MTKNVLLKTTQYIDAKNFNVDYLRLQLETVLNELEKVYSYLITAKYDNNKIVKWKVEYLISQEDEFNTFKVTDILEEMITAIVCSLTSAPKNTIAFKQPDLELMCKLYNPFMKKLAYNVSEHWSEISKDDAYQIACLTLVKLYKKHYYIHKALFTRSFNNEIYMQLRKSHRDIIVVSLEQSASNNEDDENLTIADSIVDTSIEDEIKQSEHDELMKTMYSNLRCLLVEVLSERQMEQFERDYLNKHTTNISRKQMQTIKKFLAKEGITYSTLLEYVLSK